jgi:hypothetical protein
VDPEPRKDEEALIEEQTGTTQTDPDLGGRGHGEAAGDAYWELINEQMAHEWRRKESLERRALTVITSSGGFVTLLLGLASFTRPQGAALASWAVRIPLASGTVAFVVSAFLALAIMRPQKYEQVATDSLQRVADSPELWLRPRQRGLRKASLIRVTMVIRARKNNGAKAQLLKLSLSAEVAGVLCVATAATASLFV